MRYPTDTPIDSLAGLPDDPGAIAVLHVDDEPEFTELVSTFLERVDDRLRVVTAGSADEGMERLGANRIDCVVSDYDMPGRNGIEFLDDVRAQYGDVPFILYTGKGSEEVASEAISAGVTDYIQKGSGTEHYELLANRCLHAVRGRRAERRAADLHRIRDVARDVNQALLRAGTREEVDRRVCDAIADADPYRFAWIGVEDPDTHRVVPRASSGDDRGYLSEIDVTTDDSATSLGPTGRALTTGELRVEQEIHAAADYAPWREAALERGFRSSAAIPLVHDTGEYGVLNVYADRPHAFDDAEQELLAELGDDIAHALHALRMRADLHRTTKRLEALFENSPNMIDIHDARGTILDANARMCEKLGYARDELCGKSVWEIDQSVGPEDAVDVWEAMEVGDRYEIEGSYRRRDGSTFPVEVHIQRLGTDEGDRFVVVSRDVSERKAREREREAIIDRVTDAIVEVDDGWRFTMVDDRAEELYGMAEADLLGESFWAVFEEAVGTRFEDEYRRVMETREPRSFEAYYDGLDGWFAVQVYPDDGGGLSFYFQEITERKERERELERIRDFFTEAERLGDLGAWEFDGTGRVTWTEGTRRIHEVDAGDDPTLEEAIEFFHPADRERVGAVAESALEDGEPYDVHARLVTARGNERWVRVRGERAGTGDDRTVRGYIQDVTEQKGRERDLEQYESIVENTEDGIYVFDADGRFRFVNQRVVDVTGMERDAWTDEHVSVLADVGTITEREVASIEAGIESIVDGDADEVSVELTPDVPGDLRVLDLRLTAFRTESGADRVIGFSRDVTERERRERELERKNERLEEFASVVSHDLRNPLNVAEGSLDLAREECDSDRLDAVARSHRRMRALIEDLLTLAREGETSADLEDVALGELVERCWENVGTSAATLVTGTTRTIRADPGRLQQLLENLFRNAVEHGSTGSRPGADDVVEHGATSNRTTSGDAVDTGGPDVTVTVGDLDDGFYVEDDGPGIPVDRREAVFEAGHSAAGGTGFGLAIVQDVVDAHGWEIGVTEVETGGARFEITGIGGEST